MATITITKAQVLDKLTAESTNASRTAKRQDGVSEFEEIMIDQQAMDSLEGAWLESFAKLTEKMHEFLTNYDNDGDIIEFEFAQIVEDGIPTNILMYIVDYMMQDWLASVRPDFRAKYVERANFEMDDLLRKLYKKESPV